MYCDQNITVGLQRYEHQGKFGVRNCEIFVSLKFDNIDDCKTCENEYTVWLAKRISTWTTVTVRV